MLPAYVVTDMVHLPLDWRVFMRASMEFLNMVPAVSGRFVVCNRDDLLMKRAIINSKTSDSPSHICSNL
jgi:hypothetical protein